MLLICTKSSLWLISDFMRGNQLLDKFWMPVPGVIAFFFPFLLFFFNYAYGNDDDDWTLYGRCSDAGE